MNVTQSAVAHTAITIFSFSYIVASKEIRLKFYMCIGAIIVGLLFTNNKNKKELIKYSIGGIILGVILLILATYFNNNLFFLGALVSCFLSTYSKNLLDNFIKNKIGGKEK